jgi:hypothetical protein
MNYEFNHENLKKIDVVRALNSTLMSIIFAFSNFDLANSSTGIIYTENNSGGAVQFDTIIVDQNQGNIYKVPSNWAITTSHNFTKKQLDLLQKANAIKYSSKKLQCPWGLEAAVEIDLEAAKQLGIYFKVLNQTSSPAIKIDRDTSVDLQSLISRSTSPNQDKNGERFNQRNFFNTITTLRKGDSGSALLQPQNITISGQKLAITRPAYILYAGPNFQANTKKIYAWNLQDGNSYSMNQVQVGNKVLISTKKESPPNCKQ